MSSTFAAAAVLPTAIVETFGGAVVYTRKTGEVIELTATFDASATVRELDGDGRPFATVRPVLYVRLTDVQPAKNDRWLVGGVAYVVQEVRPDGAGGAELLGVRA